MVEQGTMPASPKTRRPRCPGCRGFTYEVLTFKMRISMIGNYARSRLLLLQLRVSLRLQLRAISMETGAWSP